jgi:CubicO group peptidase (beta-lactamase class C family)
VTARPTRQCHRFIPRSRPPARRRDYGRRVAGLLPAVLLTGVAMAAVPGGVSAATGGAATSTNGVDVQRIDAFVRDQVSRHGIPGLAIAVVDGGRTIMARGYGTADSSGRAVTAQTPFVLASVSKPVTATAVMQLVDAGQVRLDSPVQRYLPEFRVADLEASARITVRELLTHTSGLPASGCERDASTLRAFVASLRQVSLDAAPGAKFTYCSGNYNILGRLVERVSGESFGRYVRQHIFGPLHMSHSYTSEAPAQSDGLAQGHRWIFGEVTPMHHYNASGVPSGYLISSAEDMSHFLSASLNHGRYGRMQVLPSAAVIAMQHRQVDAGDGTTYGLGWRQGSLGGVPAVYHFGENYDSETLAFMEPQNRRGAVILSNAQGILATVAYRSIENGVARLLDGQDPSAALLSVPTLYAGFDTLVVVSLALVLLPLIRLRRWTSRLAQQRRPRPRTVLRIAVEIVIPVLVVVLGQLFIGMIGATWHEIFLLVPDVVGWLGALCVAVFATGLLHAAIATRLVIASKAGGPISTSFPHEAPTDLPLSSA